MGDSERAGPSGWAERWLVPAIYVLCALAFVADLYRNNTLAFGIVYVPLVATAVSHRRRWGLWALTAAACAMAVTGAFFPALNPNLPDLIGNRVLSVLAILATAAFVHHARVVRDRLGEATRRAEAAERMKTEVFGNLGQEMRAPLHKLIAVLNLMMLDCRPDQKPALAGIRAGGEQLLRTIDNLAALASIDDLYLDLSAVEVTAILHDAADRARDTAGDGQVAITTEPGPPVAALADARALRQILDNLIANALQATPAGGSVSLSVRRSDRRVTIRVTDTGAGLPPGIMTGRGSGAGLTLCHQLARAMEGTLLLENAAGSGAVASLCLPAAGEKLTDPISPSRIMPRPSGTQATRPPPPHAADRG